MTNHKSIDDILMCINRNNSGEGLDRNGNVIKYCPLIFPEYKRIPCDCINRGNLVQIRRYYNSNEYMLIEVYKCNKGE